MMNVLLTILLVLFLSCNNDISNEQVKNDEDKEIDIKIPELEKYIVNINYENTYFVSTTGNDYNSGTRDKPWKSIEYAVNSVAPGDRVLILEGEYIENIYPTTSGTKDNYITIEGEGNVIIRSSGSNCFGLLNNSYLYFKNLKLTGAKYANFGAYDETLTGKVNNIILDQIESYESFVGVSLNGIKNALIVNSNLHNNQYNLELIEYNEDITISNNNIHSTSIRDSDLEPYWSHSLLIFSTGEKGKVNKNLKIINNNVYGGHMQGILAYRTEYTLIDGNNCFNNGATGIQVESDDMQDSRNIIVQNNKCYNNSLRHDTEGGIWIDDTVNAIVRNNESYGNELGLIISGSQNVSAYNNYVYDNNHSTYINGGGLSVTSSKGQSGQDGVECTNINIFNNRFINNGALSQRAQIVIGYYEYDTDLRVSNFVFKNNIVANTPNNNIYKLDLQVFGDNIKLDYNHYYNDIRDSYFYWQMTRDPWGDYKSDEPNILKSIPGNDLNSSFEKIKQVTKTHLAEIIEIVDNRTVIVDNSNYFCDGFGIVSGDYVLIDNKTYEIEMVNYSTNLVKFKHEINPSVGDTIEL